MTLIVSEESLARGAHTHTHTDTHARTHTHTHTHTHARARTHRLWPRLFFNIFKVKKFQIGEAKVCLCVCVCPSHAHASAHTPTHCFVCILIQMLLFNVFVFSVARNFCGLPLIIMSISAAPYLVRNYNCPRRVQNQSQHTQSKIARTRLFVYLFI